MAYGRGKGKEQVLLHRHFNLRERKRDFLLLYFLIVLEHNFKLENYSLKKNDTSKER